MIGLIRAYNRATASNPISLAHQHPKITALETALQELRRAPLLAKTAAAERVAALSLELFAELDARLRKVEDREHP